MQHLDEGTIHTWLDGQLPAEKADEIVAHASECPECAAMIAEARGLAAASTRILTALDNIPAGVTPVGSERAGALIVRRRWYDRTDLRVAATLLFVAGASLVVARGGRESIPSRAMMKMADTARSQAPVALDTATAEPFGTEKPTENRVAKRAPISNMPVMGRRTPESRTLADAVQKSLAPATPAPAVMQAEAVALPAVTLAETVDISRTPLRVLRVDSSASTTRTVYGISPDVEVTLAESRVDTAVQRDSAMAEAGRTNEAAAQRAVDAAKERMAGSTVAGGVSGISGGKIDQTMAMTATAPVPLNTISWTDHGRRYTLTGRLTTRELDVLKTRLMKMRR
jgi:hypothetical protein